MDRTSLSSACLSGWGAGWLAEAQRALKDTGAPELSGVLCSQAISGLEEHWGSSGGVLSGLFVLQFRASKDTRATAVRYCFWQLQGLRKTGDPAVC